MFNPRFAVMDTPNSVRLTQFSHGAGCGCKISPKILEEIIKPALVVPDADRLLVGNNSRDDAAVYDLGNGNALISTTDFFMPIVDDAYDFGRIAAANAISDVYAMGGRPLMAIAILGWPVEKLPVELAQQVIEGGRMTCNEAGIPLAGGHSIDSAEPIFGLAVSGIVPKENLKKNNTANSGDWIFLSKPLGVGILSTAQKREALKPEYQEHMIRQMTDLNKMGEELGKLSGVTALTDVTGFGLLGHLIEMAEGSGHSAEIYYNKIQTTEGVRDYISKRIFPDATTRNWSSYSHHVVFEKGVNVMEAFTLLPDPQTNGGLLFSVNEESLDVVRDLMVKSNLEKFTDPVGRFIPRHDKLIYVKN